MTTADLIAALTGRPQEFTVGAVSVLLRPLTYADRAALIAWDRPAGDGADVGQVLQRKYLALAVCDEAGQRLLSEEDVGRLPALAVDAISAEVARRNGLLGDPDPKAPTPGNETSPAA